MLEEVGRDPFAEPWERRGPGGTVALAFWPLALGQDVPGVSTVSSRWVWGTQLRRPREPAAVLGFLLWFLHRQRPPGLLWGFESVPCRGTVESSSLRSFQTQSGVCEPPWPAPWRPAREGRPAGPPWAPCPLQPGVLPSLRPRTNGLPPTARAPRLPQPARPRWHSGTLRTLARCPRPRGLARVSFRNPSAAQAHLPHPERKGGHPTSGCGAVWRLEAAVAAVRIPLSLWASEWFPWAPAGAV